MIDCIEYCHHSRKKYQLVAWRQEYSNIKKFYFSFHGNPITICFFNFAFYQKHLEFALYMVFWVHTSKFYFMPHCHICFRRQFLTPLPFQNLTQVHNFHSQDIYIINFQGNSNFFHSYSCISLQEGKSKFDIFLFVTTTNFVHDGTFRDFDICLWYS